MSLYALDVEALYERLDKQRTTRGISWRELGRKLGIASPTFSRMKQGGCPDSDSLVTLLVWLDMDTDIVWIIKAGKEDES